MRPWTPEDTAQLKALVGTMTVPRVARTMHRSERLLRRVAQQEGISLQPLREWRQPQIDAMRRVIEAGGTTEDAALAAGRSVDAVRNKVRGLKLRLNGTPRHHCTDWSEAQIETMRRIAAAGGSREDVAKAAGRSVSAVAHKAPLLGIRFARKEYAPREVRATRMPAGPAPRERVGLPRAQRSRPIIGTVKWCPECHAPVLDTAQKWAEHRWNRHTQPIRRIA